MSAFIVSRKHIDSLVTAYLDEAQYYSRVMEIDIKHLNKIGQTLIIQNAKSFNYRYNEKEPVELYRFNSVKQSPIQILKACHCYNYQACETPDYKNSEARSIIKKIEAYIMTQLPGYAEAQWEIN